ncbi:MAG: glycosyltransferase [Acidimicrobiia bacterium]|nr:glycosyltransferase [Acidimicrobiia bacterium]
MRHLLVTNDFPPKVGGIQTYLWELWRRLPPAEVVVHTTPYRGHGAFDAAAPFPVVRSREPVLLPSPVVRARVDRLAARHDVDLVVIDPGVPLGLIAPFLERPYAIVVHGAEVTMPGRVPGTAQLLARVLRGARLVVAAGPYPAAEAERCAGRALPTVVVPPGVDPARFRPLEPGARLEARSRLGLEPEDLVVASVSRLVPRKGMDVLIRATARLRPRHPGLRVVIGGRGRDRERLGRLVASIGAPVSFLDFVPDADLPVLLGAADIFAMLCRTRWGGLEQEGFGIVFAEAAACGVPQVCGLSGGSADAVSDGETGLVVTRPSSVASTTAALDRLLGDEALRSRLGDAGRARSVAELAYPVLVHRLEEALRVAAAGPVPVRSFLGPPGGPSAPGPVPCPQTAGGAR